MPNFYYCAGHKLMQTKSRERRLLPLMMMQGGTRFISPVLRLAGVFLLAVLMAACVTPPFSSKSTSLEISPLEALDGQVEPGTRIMWGGVIVSSSNTPEGSELTLLSYPLDYLQRPLAPGGKSNGHVLIKTGNYLETLDFAPGARVTAVGNFSAVEPEKLGESRIQYAVLEQAEIHLWTEQEYLNSSPFGRAVFGIGISITR